MTQIKAKIHGLNAKLKATTLSRTLDVYAIHGDEYLCSFDNGVNIQINPDFPEDVSYIRAPKSYGVAIVLKKLEDGTFKFIYDHKKSSFPGKDWNFNVTVKDVRGYDASGLDIWCKDDVDFFNSSEHHIEQAFVVDNRF